MPQPAPPTALETPPSGSPGAERPPPGGHRILPASLRSRFARGRRPAAWVLSLLVHVLALGVLSIADLGLREAFRERPPEAALATDPTLDPGALEAAPTPVEEVDLRSELPARTDVATDVERAPVDAPKSTAFESVTPPADPTQAPRERIAASLPLTNREVVGVGADAVPMGRTFSKDEAAEAMGEVGAALMGDPYAGRVLRRVRGAAGGRRVVVLQGEFDQCEDVLRGLGIPYELLDPQVLVTQPMPAEVRVAVLNCSPKPLHPQSLSNLRDWVDRGGYLLTTDWGIETVLDRAFRQYVQCAREGRRVQMLEERVVNVEVASDHPLMRGLAGSERMARWWLEKSTIPLQINAPDAVEVLIACPSLRLTHDAPGAAVTFRHGRGRVVHLLGHVYQQEGNLRGAFIVQRLLLNFLREALVGR